MKIYVVHATKNFDFQEQLYKPINDSDLAKEHEIILPHQNQTEKLISSKEIIMRPPFEGGCDFVFAEISSPSTGSGIELGWADAVGKQIVCVYQKDKQPSSAIKIITDNIFPYEKSSELIDVLRKKCSEITKKNVHSLF